MIKLGSSVFQTRPDVTGLKIGEIGQNLHLGNTRSEQIKHVLHAYSHPSYARPATALVGIVGDTFHVMHTPTVGIPAAFRKAGPPA